MIRRTARTVMVATAAAILGGCGGMSSLTDPSQWFGESDTKSTAVAVGDAGFTVSQGQTNVPVIRPITETDLVAADGTCASAPAESAPLVSGVTLTMTECALVALAGQPEKVDIGTSGGKERRVVLTYSKREHPGIYTFEAGRLKIINPAPAAAKPEPRKRTPRKRRS